MHRMSAAEAYEAWRNQEISGNMEYLTEIGKWVDFSFANSEGASEEGYFDIWSDTFDRRIHSDAEVRVAAG